MSASRPEPSDRPDTFVIAPGLASADLGGESVLLDPTSGRYFGLNEVGARILAIVTEPRTLDQVTDVLAAEYEADRAQLYTDAEQFLRMLAERDLVTVTSHASA